MTVSLQKLPFIDLYIRLDAVDAPMYRSNEKGKTNLSQLVPEEYLGVVERFGVAVAAAMHDDDGSIEFDSVRCRLSRQKMFDGSMWACARRINTELPILSKLGFAPHITQHMRGLGARDGLILISGATGAGKTTTAVALLADFLRNYGGTAVAIEDPVEYLLRGRHGAHGQCFQVEAQSDDDWAVCLKRALRWSPRYIFVGEIRTTKAAEQLLRAATTGHTVITTVHAGTPEEALMGIQFLAEQSMGPGCSSILATGLTALIYQTMRDIGPYARYVFTEETAGDPIRSIIREGKIGMISTYIDRIEARLANSKGANQTAPSLADSGKKP